MCNSADGEEGVRGNKRTGAKCHVEKAGPVIGALDIPLESTTFPVKSAGAF